MTERACSSCSKVMGFPIKFFNFSLNSSSLIAVLPSKLNFSTTMVSPSGNSSVGVGIVGGDSSVGSELGRGEGTGDGDGVGIIGSGNWVGGIVCAFVI